MRGMTGSAPCDVIAAVSQLAGEGLGRDGLSHLTSTLSLRRERKRGSGASGPRGCVHRREDQGPGLDQVEAMGSGKKSPGQWSLENTAIACCQAVGTRDYSAARLAPALSPSSEALPRLRLHRLAGGRRARRRQIHRDQQAGRTSLHAAREQRNGTRRGLRFKGAAVVRRPSAARRSQR